ncbi:MAG: hypothetical protein KAS01_02265 [Candidatus Pacebacteria bacterium]|nr:hypothetical protein [Candidatus Paceibacterota bacterium]
MVENKLTKNERKLVEILGLLAPKLGVLSDFGYYIKNGKIIIRSNKIKRIIKIIKLIQKMELVNVEGNTAELKLN